MAQLGPVLRRGGDSFVSLVVSEPLGVKLSLVVGRSGESEHRIIKYFLIHSVK